MFQIKICGVTSVQDARCVAQSGADAIGLNFYAQSKRYLELDVARSIAECLPTSVQRVGVFVNESADRVRWIASELRLNWVQIHGDEPPSFLEQLAGLQIIRALRIRNHGWQNVTDYLRECHLLRCAPQAVLLDAFHDKQYGGTGCRLNWTQLYYVKPQLGGIPWVLAGGLTADNVQQAIQQAHPNAVDTASGVESAAGQKDPDQVASFVTNAHRGFDQVER